MIDRQTVFEIHRLHNLGFAERKIARKLRLSRPTVKKYIENPEPARQRKISRASKLDAYREQIKAFLEQDTVNGYAIQKWINNPPGAVLLTQQMEPATCGRIYELA